VPPVDLLAVGKATVRIIEIADLLGMSHQRPSKIAGERGFPAPVGREGRSRTWDRREVVARANVWRAGKPGDRPHFGGTFAPLARAIGVITIQEACS
jgi:hypothetical protein